MTEFDAILLVSFGGPEGFEDIMPFLRNVVRGKNVPDSRLAEVAHHYEIFGGVSPINDQNRQLIKALRAELDKHEINLPIYWGNRNWHPMLEDTVAEMAAKGVKRALAFVTSAYSSYPGCRQYLEDIERARSSVGPSAPEIEKIPVFYNQPGFIDANVARVQHALERLREISDTIDTSTESGTSQIHVAFTAHSIPLSMARGCSYEEQLNTVAQKVADRTGVKDWKLVYQSRSGPPSMPWLVPDICDHIRSVVALGCKNILIAPIGFISDHMEVIYDLDQEAVHLCVDNEVDVVRAETVGTHPAFVSMIRELIAERLSGTAATSELCGPGCCPYSIEASVQRSNATG